jgi:hypothetical protein
LEGDHILSIGGDTLRGLRKGVFQKKKGQLARTNVLVPTIHHIWGLTLTCGTFHARCHSPVRVGESGIYITEKLLPDLYIVYT